MFFFTATLKIGEETEGGGQDGENGSSSFRKEPFPSPVKLLDRDLETVRTRLVGFISSSKDINFMSAFNVAQVKTKNIPIRGLRNLEKLLKKKKKEMAKKLKPWMILKKRKMNLLLMSKSS